MTLGRHMSGQKQLFVLNWPDIIYLARHHIRDVQIKSSVFAAIFLSRLSLLYLLQCQLLKYVHVGQLQSIKKYILSYTYELPLCYLWLERHCKKNNFKHQVSMNRYGRVVYCSMLMGWKVLSGKFVLAAKELEKQF